MSKLTQEELFTALYQGKKVRKTTWKPEHYIYLFNGNIISQDSWIIHQLDLQADWELYIETVSFFEALYAMKDGKKAKKINFDFVVLFDKYGFLSYLDNGHTFEVTIKDLDAKWIILEGDSE